MFSPSCSSDFDFFVFHCFLYLCNHLLVATSCRPFTVAARALARLFLDAPRLGALLVDRGRVRGGMDPGLSDCAPHLRTAVRGLQWRQVLAGGVRGSVCALCFRAHWRSPGGEREGERGSDWVWGDHDQEEQIGLV